MYYTHSSQNIGFCRFIMLSIRKNFCLTAPSDYLSISMSLVIPAGETSQEIDISILRDRILETNEEFSVQLLSTINPRVILLPDQSTTSVTIIDTTSGKHNFSFHDIRTCIIMNQSMDKFTTKIISLPQVNK